MRRFFILVLAGVALSATLALPSAVRAGSSGVTDDGHFFTSDAIRQADDLIREHRGHVHPDIRVITVPSIPADMQNDFESQGKNPFFEHWAKDLFKRDNVNGVLILICKKPGHYQVEQGDKTREKAFTDTDRRALQSKLGAALTAHKYDDGLLDAVRFIKDREAANLPAPHHSTVAPPVSSPPAAQPWTSTPTPTPMPGPATSHFMSLGSWICFGVVILLVVVVIMSLVNRNRNYGGGYGAPPPGGYPPGYSGPYPQGGGYGGGGGGGGFGSGLLGGLLGGAVGAWGYDKLSGRNNPNYIPGSTPGPAGYPGGGTQPDPSDQPDTSSSGGGGDFDSGPSGGSESSGGDFGGGSDSGGGDFGGGGSDSGGGDFGGGGGDSGGGGDF